MSNKLKAAGLTAIIILLCILFGALIYSFAQYVMPILMLAGACILVYSNGSIVTDGRFGQINNNGNIFEI